jgi:hypothetical protein
VLRVEEVRENMADETEGGKYPNDEVQRLVMRIEKTSIVTDALTDLLRWDQDEGRETFEIAGIERKQVFDVYQGLQKLNDEMWQALAKQLAKTPTTLPDTLTDADVQGVMLALGSVLTWGPHHLDANGVEALIDDKRYEIRPAATYIGRFAVLVFSRDGRWLYGGSRTEYLDIPAAKAACERHYRTFQWD